MLGGRDLEMLEIKKILERRKGDDLLVCDKGLSWNDALLGKYEDELGKYGGLQECQIYGVELRENVPVPENYTAIDHHGESDGRPSSLEQIAGILGEPMDRRMRLVAANDSRYIPGMLAEGATAQEVENIRRDDRRSQGVKEETEKEVSDVLNGIVDYVGDLKIVNVPKNLQSVKGVFSVISDRLYPYVALVINTDKELCYYGKDAEQVRKQIFPEGCEGLYSGGGRDGYWGVDSENGRYIRGVLEEVKKYWKIYSYHIFYFPFKWNLKDAEGKFFTDRYDVSGLDTRENPQTVWKRVKIDKDAPLADVMDIKEASEIFNEKQYFFEFVHPVLYDGQEKKNNILRHYERLEPAAGNVTYEIELKDKIYELKVDSITLNIYSTGIGILAFYLANRKESQKDEKDVRMINQYGRRFMPPHAGEFDVSRRSLLAMSISIRGLHSDAAERYTDTFPYSYLQGNNRKGLYDTWSVSSMIHNLIHDIFSSMEVAPIVDDRMLVNCWYGNNDLSRGIAAYNSFKDFWYKFVYLDEGDSPTCQDREMLDRLLSESTYTRWKDCGTLYGVSRYSIVALTNEDGFATSVLAMHMRTIYARLFELMIVQRASLLRFSEEVTEVCRLGEQEEKFVAKRINSLYLGYIRFINQIYFRSVTTQDQGIELYEMISKQFDTGHQIKALDGEIDELNRYIDLKINDKRNENGELLNKLAAIFLPPSLIVGIFGMNRIGDIVPDLWWYIGCVMAVIVLSLLLIRSIIRRKRK